MTPARFPSDGGAWWGFVSQPLEAIAPGSCGEGLLASHLDLVVALLASTRACRLLAAALVVSAASRAPGSHHG
jgi:hypothetical protein